MNRLIILDNLRHGWWWLLGIGVIYLAIAVLLSDRVFLADGDITTATILLGSFPVLLGMLSRPGARSIGSDLLTEWLLPVSATEIVNTHWLQSVVLPALWLTLCFIIGWLLGLAGRVIEAMGPLFPLHLLATYLCATSLMFGSVTGVGLRLAINRYLSVPWPLILYLLALIVPFVYLQALLTLRDSPAFSFLLIAVALLLVGRLQRAACSVPIIPERGKSLPEPSTARKRAEPPPIAGFKGLILAAWKLLLFFAVFFTYVAPVADCVTDIGPCTGVFTDWFEESITIQLVVVCVLLRWVQDASFASGVDLRVLRTLPISAQSITGRYVFIASGVHWAVVCLALWPVAIYLEEVETALDLTAFTFFLIGVSAVLSPIFMVLRTPGRFLAIIGAMLCLGLLSGGFYDGYLENRVAGIALTSTLGLATLLLSWWAMNRLISQSSEVYKLAKLSRSGS